MAVFDIDAVASVRGVESAIGHLDGSAATKNRAIAVVDVEVVDDQSGIQAGEGVGGVDGIEPAGGTAQGEVVQGGRAGGVFEAQAAPAGVLASEEMDGGRGCALNDEGALNADVAAGGEEHGDPGFDGQGDLRWDDQVGGEDVGGGVGAEGGIGGEGAAGGGFS